LSHKYHETIARSAVTRCCVCTGGRRLKTERSIRERTTVRYALSAASWHKAANFNSL